MSDWFDAAGVDEIEPGSCKVVYVDDVMIAVINVDGEFHAIEDVCTHDGGELASGCILGDTIECPCHFAKFSIITGEVLDPPAYEPVPVFPVKVENGRVFVRNDRWD